MFTLRLLKLKIHSRRVFIFKRSLPVFAFLLASVMIVWPALNEQNDKFAMIAPTAKSLKDSNSDMESVRFFSKDKEQNPITVTAQTVREMEKNRQIISLVEPRAKYVMSDGVVLTGITPYGLAFQKEKYLYFEERVDSQTNTGYIGESEKVVCDYNAGTIGSEQDIFIKGPAGMLRANGFFVKDKGNYLHFKGHAATLMFHQQQPINVVEMLDFDKQRSYLSQDKQNIYLTSENGLIINQVEKTVTALKNVDVYQDNNHLESQLLVLNYIKNEQGKTEIQRVTARENVVADLAAQKATGHELIVYRAPAEIATVIQTLAPYLGDDLQSVGQVIELNGKAVITESANTIRADKIYAVYDASGSEMQKVIALGNMSATNGVQRIYGNYGIYTPATKIISVHEKVSLHEKESVLKGEYATLNLKTGISSLSAPKQGETGGRVRGQIIPNDFETKKTSEEK